MARFPFQSGAETFAHSRSGTTIVGMTSGTLGRFSVGTANVVRGASSGAADPVEDITDVGTEAILEPGDVTYYADDVAHTASGAGNTPAVVHASQEMATGEGRLMPMEMEMGEPRRYDGPRRGGTDHKALSTGEPVNGPNNSQNPVTGYVRDMSEVSVRAPETLDVVISGLSGPSIMVRVITIRLLPKATRLTSRSAASTSRGLPGPLMEPVRTSMDGLRVSLVCNAWQTTATRIGEAHSRRSRAVACVTTDCACVHMSRSRLH